MRFGTIPAASFRDLIEGECFRRTVSDCPGEKGKRSGGEDVISEEDGTVGLFDMGVQKMCLTKGGHMRRMRLPARDDCSRKIFICSGASVSLLRDKNQLIIDDEIL